MYNYATVIDILQSGCHYIICKFWFENDTLIQVRYCHLLDICYVDSAHNKIYVDIYLNIFGCIVWTPKLCSFGYLPWRGRGNMKN